MTSSRSLSRAFSYGACWRRRRMTLSVLRTSKKAPWEEQDEDPGCLEPGENKLMLEFIGMDGNCDAAAVLVILQT